ncbi:UNVERIFIED_CONTAM: hypothetical protein HDU68_004212, partial [Siphonaria sp. JEL0065]
SIGSEDRYEPYKRRANSGISTSPSAMFMSPTTQPMSIPNSPSVSWIQPPPAPNTSSTPTDKNPATAKHSTATTTSNSGGSTPMTISTPIHLNPPIYPPDHHHHPLPHHRHHATHRDHQNSFSSTMSSSSQAMTGIQQPLLPGPVMGLMLSGYMGSPMMRRSTSASSAGSMADRSERGGISIFGTGGSNGGPGNTPGSPRIGVVFGGGANVVVGASPRGNNGFVVSGFLGNNNGSGGGGGGGGGSGGTGLGVNVGGFQSGTPPVSQFGQLLNMGGAQDHLSKMSLS